MEGKEVSLSILGIVAVISVAGLVLMFNTALTGQGVYGGALKGEPYPYLTDRAVGHRSSSDGVQQIATLNDAQFRAWERSLRSTPSANTACSGLASSGVIPPGLTVKAGADLARDFMFSGFNCVDASHLIAGWCCEEAAVSNAFAQD